MRQVAKKSKQCPSITMIFLSLNAKKQTNGSRIKIIRSLLHLSMASIIAGEQAKIKSLISFFLDNSATVDDVRIRIKIPISNR